MAEAQYRAWEIYGQDAVVAQSDNYYIAEGFGVKVEHYEDATPTFKAPAIEALAEVGRVRLPDPTRDGRMPVYLEAIQRLSEMTRGQVAVRAPGTGPFSLASHILGTERFLVELALAEREPGGPGEQALKHLLESEYRGADSVCEGVFAGRGASGASRRFARLAGRGFSRHISQVGLAVRTAFF